MNLSCLSRLSRRFLPLAALSLGTLVSIDGLHSSASAATHTAVDSAQLTSLLNNSSVVLGDTIILNAGTTYNAPSGGFILRAKSGTGYLTIQSSNMASLPAAGVRVTPANAADMPNIVSPGANLPAIRTAAVPEVAHHYKFIGIEIYNGGTQTELSNMIALGDGGSAQNSASLVPYDFVFDRCYVHGQNMTPGTNQMRRAFALNCGATDIVNCYVSDVLSNAGQTACIGGWNGAGPYNIDNNFFSCSGENIIFGGASGHVVGQNPTGIVVSRNHFYKDPAWKGTWTRPCNHFELKHGKNVIVRDNLMENCWNNSIDSQFGVSINLKCVQGGSGAGSSWFVTEDITIENNLIRNVGMGIQMAGSVSSTGGSLIGQPRNITIRNNLIYDVAVTEPGDKGWLFYMNNGSPNVTIDHNTGFATNYSMFAGDNNQPHNSFVYTNNMTMKGSFGFSASGMSDGEVTLAAYFPGVTYQKNVTMGSSLAAYDPNYLAGWNLAPFNNASLLVPSSWSGVLQNQSTPGADFSGWKVVGWDQPTNTSSFPYNNTGTDGKDIGCDIDLLNSKIAGCVSGNWGPPPSPPSAPSGLGATAVSSSQINLNWADNSSNESNFELDRATNSTFTSGLVTTTLGANVTSASATGLAASTTYYFRVRATNSGGASAYSNTANATTQSPSGPTTMHVSSIVVTVTGNGNNKRGRAVVNVVNNLGQNVADATVTGNFTGTFNETGRTGVTTSGGAATITTNGKSGGTPSVTFTVTNITHASLSYNPSANVETSDHN